MYLLYRAAPILTISLKRHEITMVKSFMCFSRVSCEFHLFFTSQFSKNSWQHFREFFVCLAKDTNYLVLGKTEPPSFVSQKPESYSIVLEDI